jgi:hypothetical protein
MAKGRSPNYPSQTLAEAVERLRPVYNELHTYVTPTEVFAENLGYTSLSGRALGLIATLKRYGLIEGGGKGMLRISGLAVSIMELPEGSTERGEALEQAAFTPELFSELRSEFPNDLPSDGLLRHHLVKKGFLPKAAEEIIRVFKANLDLVQERPEEYNPPMSSPTTETRAENVRREGGIRAGLPRNVVEENDKFLPQWEYRFNVSRTTIARVIFVGGEATQEAIAKLISTLEVQKDTFPTEADLQASIEPLEIKP